MNINIKYISFAFVFLAVLYLATSNFSNHKFDVDKAINNFEFAEINKDNEDLELATFDKKVDLNIINNKSANVKELKIKLDNSTYYIKYDYNNNVLLNCSNDKYSNISCYLDVNEIKIENKQLDKRYYLTKDFTLFYDQNKNILYSYNHYFDGIYQHIGNNQSNNFYVYARLEATQNTTLNRETIKNNNIFALATNIIATSDDYKYYDAFAVDYDFKVLKDSKLNLIETITYDNDQNKKKFKIKLYNCSNIYNNYCYASKSMRIYNYSNYDTNLFNFLMKITLEDVLNLVDFERKNNIEYNATNVFIQTDFLFSYLGNKKEEYRYDYYVSYSDNEDIRLTTQKDYYSINYFYAKNSYITCKYDEKTNKYLCNVINKKLIKNEW